MLLAVSKAHPAEAVRAAYAAGQQAFGENYLQEALAKQQELADLTIAWHFIGPLQRNKVKYLSRVRLVHTIEAAWQAEAIAQAAQGWGHAPDVLLQLHNGEAQKHGVPVAELPDTLRAVQATGLRVRGLMVIAPDVETGADQAGILRVFQDTADRAHDLGLAELSMGMSADYPLAVQAGATLIRVGRSLFT